MENLFNYRATAFIASDDADYIRLEIKVNLPSDHFSTGIYCRQVCVWLPVGDSGESITSVAPIPFVVPLAQVS